MFLVVLTGFFLLLRAFYQLSTPLQAEEKALPDQKEEDTLILSTNSNPPKPLLPAHIFKPDPALVQNIIFFFKLFFSFTPIALLKDFLYFLPFYILWQ